MTKPFVLCMGFAAAFASIPASAADAPADQTNLQRAFETYDQCLADATVRAQRAGAPMGTVGDLSKQACAETRAVLLRDPLADPALAGALDLLDRVRKQYESSLALAAKVSEPDSRRARFVDPPIPR